VRADLLADERVDLAGEQPQRQADHAALMRHHALDGEMGLAGVGRTEHRGDVAAGKPLDRGGQAKYWPPLAEMVEPVMKPASSEARNTTQRAISAGSPRRPTGIWAMMDSRTFLRDGHHHVGADIAGADDVDGDAGARAFLRQRLGETDIAGLRGRVVRLPHLALLAVDRGDGDDAAELAVAHAGPERMRHVEDAVEVGADDLVPLLARHLVEHGVAGDAGIVDQHVDRAEIGLHLGDAGRAGVVVGDRPLVGLDAGLGGEFLRRLVIAGIVRRDLVAGILQRDRDRRADAARTAGDQCNTCHAIPSRY
jgi:hypothetical protein